MKYVNVIVKNKSKGTNKLFLYAEGSDQLSVGDKVLVPFGKSNKLIEAYIAEIYDSLNENILNEVDVDQIKEVASLVESKCFSNEVISLALWLSREYFSRILDCLDLFRPSGAKPKRVESKKLVRVMDHYKDYDHEDVELSPKQMEIFNEVASSFHRNFGEKEFLLQGVTASGKTEIYIQLCKEALKGEKRALVVVPEIFLTKQLIEKFKIRFSNLGDQLAVLHSGLKNREIHEQWDKIKNGQAKIVIGSRMTLFTPIENLGLIILDEEHSSSYKSDKNPKYLANEVALELGKIQNAIVLLGSSTPSMNSLKLVEDGVLKKLILDEKFYYSNNQLDIVDMSKELRAGNKTIFSRSLYDSIISTLEKGEQALIIMGGGGKNFLSCRSCGHVEKCPHCNIALTKLPKTSTLKCSYCGYKRNDAQICSNCGSKLIKAFGLDLEKLVEETKKYFPQARIKSIDWKDSANVKALSTVIEEMEEGEIDILVSTQLFSRGLDIKNITTVGVIALDSASNTFDFRGGERTFQLIIQSLGRGGRSHKEGKVIFQTYKMDYYPIGFAFENDIDGFYKEEKRFRQPLGYYPFGNLMQITLLGKNEKIVERVYYNFLKEVEKNFGRNIVLGKQFTKNKEDMNVKFHILLKVPLENMDDLRKLIKGFEEKMGRSKYTVHLLVDKNPKKQWRN